MKLKIQDSKKSSGNSIGKKLFLLTAMFLFTFSIQAQDKKAKDLLDQVTAKVKSYNNIAIDFKYSLNNAKENINQDSKGNVTMKGNQYVLNFMGVTKFLMEKKRTQSFLRMKKLRFLHLTRKTIMPLHLLKC